MIFISNIISPKYDFMFKLCFDFHDKQKHLQNFFTNVLDISIDNLITKGQVKLKKYFKTDKTGRLDILTHSNNSILIIEMQNCKSSMNCFRFMYYWSKAFLDQIVSNKRYTDLLPCYAVLITDYVFDNSNNCICEYSINFEKYKLECLKLFVIQLPKFNKVTANLNNDKDLWLLFLTATSKSAFDKIRGKNKYIDDCIKEVEKMSEEEELREIRRMHEKWDFERKLENDYKFKKGTKNAQMHMVKKLYNLNSSIQFIEQVTGLSQNEIQETIDNSNISA